MRFCWCVWSASLPSASQGILNNLVSYPFWWHSFWNVCHCFVVSGWNWIHQCSEIHDTQMGRVDASTWRWPTNVIPSRIFWMVASIANHGWWFGSNGFKTVNSKFFLSQESWLVNPKMIQLVKIWVLLTWTSEGALVLPSLLRLMPSNI